MTRAGRRIGSDVAIVGVACRLPGGVTDPAGFWEVLAGGRDMIGEVGPDRWAVDLFGNPRPGEPGKSYTWRAGLLDDQRSFDPAFFGISPREAAEIDPQQRLTLELAVEALEDAGQPRAALAGSNTGVFLGVSATDFAALRWSDPTSWNAYSGTGSALSIVANRVSYCLDLRGPSLIVDTACSSSLVALHLAVMSLRRGESAAAIVGGVNVLLAPYAFIGFAQASMLSPAGRCKAFSADAHGYVRAEGGVVFYLKPLKRALADGDHVHAVIRATGINQDGRTGGLSMPSVKSQRMLLDRVYAEAGVAPADLDFIEAHGTGTAVGDPVEATAIGEALGRARDPDRPLPIGSAKSNLGHLEPASGLVGVLKALLSLNHRMVPASLHCAEPNPAIDFAALNLRVVNAPLALGNRRRSGVAGINSFGFGGTNAHAVIVSGWTPKSRQDRRSRAAPLVLSAHDPETLSVMAERYAAYLERQPQVDAYDVAFARAYRRDHSAYRLAVAAVDRSRQIDLLRAHSRKSPGRGLVSGHAGSKPARTALVFSGNGAQWHGMGRPLLEASPRARRLIARIDRLFQPLTGWSIVEELVSGDAERFTATDVAQPLLFALQLAMSGALRRHGLNPVAVVGHSVGEVAAACFAGALGLADAVRVIAARSRAQEQTRGTGLMVAVSASQTETDHLLAGRFPDLEIAGINSPTSTVVSGPSDSVRRLAGACEADGIYARILDLDYAFHSRAMDGVRAAVLDDLAPVRPHPGRLQFASSVTGRIVAGDTLTAGYWWRNIREPVRFVAAIVALADAGVDTFVEVGPHPILQSAIRESLRERPGTPTILHTFSRQTADPLRLEEVALAAYANGAPLAWSRLFPAPGRRVALPAYPWRRDHHWPEPSPETARTLDRPRVHPFLGYAVPRTPKTWENELDLDVQAALGDHRVFGVAAFPAAGFAELALAAAGCLSGTDTDIDVFDLDIREPLILADGITKSLQVQVADDRVTIRSRDRLTDAGSFSLHAEARFCERSWPLAAEESSAPRLATEALTRTVSADRVYDLAESLGLAYGPVFRRLGDVEVRGSVAEADLCEAPPLTGAGLIADPTGLDAGFQALIAILLARLEGVATAPAAFLPVRIGRLRLQRAAGRPVRVRTHLERISDRSVSASVDLLDASGAVVLRAGDCRLIRADRPAGSRRALQFRSVSVPAERPDTLAADGRAADELSHVLDPAVLAEAVRMGLAGAGGDSAFRDDDNDEAAVLLDGFATEVALRAVAAAPSESTLHVAGQDPSTGGNRLPIVEPWRRSLAADGLLASPPAEVEEPAPEIDPIEIWRTLVADYPHWAAEAILAGRAALALSPATSDADNGNIAASPPEASPATLEQLRFAGPSHASLNRALLALARATAQRWPDRRPLRVLDVGGGVAGPDRRIAAAFSAIACDYVVADANEHALARARSRLAGLPHVRFASFDPAGGEEGNGLGGERFDLVLSADMAHLRDEPSEVLRSLRRRLATRGVLVLAHRRGDRFADLVFGTSPDWWHGDARGRGPSTLMRAVRPWKVLLGDAGFTLPPVVVGAEPDDDPATVIIAVNPAAESIVGGTAGDDASGAGGDETAPLRILLSAPDSGPQSVAAGIAAILSRSGESVLRATAETLADALSAAAAGRTVEILALDGLAEAPAEAGDQPLAAAAAGCETVLAIARALDAREFQSARVRVVTRRAMMLEAEAPDGETGPGQATPAPVSAAIWGCVRVLMNEYPDVAWSLIDVQTDEAPGILAGRLAAELGEVDAEREILLTAHGRRALRFEERLAGDHDRDVPPDPLAFYLAATRPGTLDGLAWVADPQRPPGPDEVAVRVRATGLNFRDVMLAMGLLPDDVVEDGLIGATLGMECAGDIIAVGERVADYAVGDAVICFAPRSFAGRVTVAARAVARKPDDLSYAAAVTIPVTFFTAVYALEHLAAVQPGETVLIHGAAGGVGLAALQVAHGRGARVIATAGTPEKRDVLRLLGLNAVFDSRSLAFADDVRRLTAGAGVDVVLNCLAGEAAVRSLELLTPFGRFIELGKRDFALNTRIGLRPLRRNIAYFAVDADAMLAQKPDLAARILDDVLERFATGALRPLLHRVFAADEIADAFRLMQQSNHVGKIVVDLTGPPDRIAPPQRPPSPLTLDAEGLYLVAGGLGGFGARTASWLASRGARRLLLVGRNAGATGRAAEILERLTADGIDVQTVACDIADPVAVETLVAGLAGGPPLRGIVHAAMVVEDRAAAAIDEATLRRVLAPKLQGAWNLHLATRHLALDLFVLFASATTMFGNPGQAAYVAANLSLEQLARDRRRAGLPALAVCWGPIGDAGYLADNPTLRDHLTKRLGGQPLKAADALDLLDELVGDDEAVIAVLDVDWRTVKRSLPILAQPSFSRLLRNVVDLPDTVDMADLRDRLATATPEEARELIGAAIAEQAAAILRLPLDRFESDRPLVELGMDSLMGMELSLAVERVLGVPVSALGIGERTSVDTLAAGLAGRLTRGRGDGRPVNGTGDDVDAGLAALVDRHAGADDDAVLGQLVEAIDRTDRIRH